MKKRLNVIIVPIIIQLVIAFFGFYSLYETMPPSNEEIVTVENLEVKSIGLKQPFMCESSLFIEDSHKSYMIPHLAYFRLGSSEKEIKNAISAGDIINIKYYTKEGFNRIVELEDGRGNSLRSLELYIDAYKTNSIHILFFWVFVEIVFIVCCILYMLYCKYVLRIKLKKKKKRKKVDKE